MLAAINKDTVLCMSLASRPGNFGTRFHNHLYRELGIDSVYKAFTTADLEGAVRGIRALGIRGCAISMPFKEDVIRYLDALEPSAERIGAVNTIVNDGGRLTGLNTDYIAVKNLIERLGVPRSARVAALGSGGMAKAVVSALRELGFERCAVVARNAEKGQALAGAWGYEWREEMRDTFDFLINTTPIGMEPAPQGMPFSREAVAGARWVMDAVALPLETRLVRLARELGKGVITGGEVTVLQAQEQFRLYTGKTPSDDQVARAAEWARR